MTSRASQLSPRTFPFSSQPVRPARHPFSRPFHRRGRSRLVAVGLCLALAPMVPASLLAQQAPQSWPGYGSSAWPAQSQDQAPPPPDDQQPQSGWQQPPPQNFAPPQNYAPPQGYGEAQPYPSYPPADSGQPWQQQSYQPQAPQGLSPDQLDQLVAPIALYPDALLAQILAASTFPMQIEEADHWRQAQGYGAPPQAVADQANAQPWDPSVKALTAFPQVLNNLARNLSWTTELGNAYYNQPQDVFDAVQDLRQRAQAAGDLESTPQETVSDDQGYIALAPVNPQIVYVPSYDPWSAYGAPIAPWPGFSFLDTVGSLVGTFGMHFGPGLVMSAFMNMPWGWLGWGLSWLGHSLFYDHNGWYPHSPTLADWGLPHGGPRAGWGRPMEARGYDRGYDRGLNRGYGGYNSGYGRAGSYGRDTRSFPDRGFADRGIAANRGYSDPRSGYGYANRAGQQSFNRMPAFNARSGYGNQGAWRGYNSGSYGRSQAGWRNTGYGRSPQTNSFNRGFSNGYRQPESSFRSSAPAYRAYSGSSSFGRDGFSGSSRGSMGFSSHSRSSDSFYGGNRSHSSSHFGFGGGHSSHYGGGSHFSHSGGGGHFHSSHSSHGGGHRR